MSDHQPVGGAAETDGLYRLGGGIVRRVLRHVLTARVSGALGMEPLSCPI